MELKLMKYCVTGIALTFALTACGNDQQAATSSPAPATKSASQAPPAAMPPAAGELKGKVAETMDASGYTYVRLDNGSGQEIWAAVPKTQLQVGEEISLQGGSVMANFSSKTLNRTFEEIIFASGVLRGSSGAQAAASPGSSSFADAVQSEGAAEALPSSGGSAGNIVPFSDLKVEKAAGANGYTIGDIFSKATELDAKPVVIKGQVVKISRNIMGKNWLHLQDGTGDPAKNNHDLVVTTMDVADRGDIITFAGTLAANKDFGSGYKYAVIVEDGSISKDE